MKLKYLQTNNDLYLRKFNLQNLTKKSIIITLIISDLL